MHGLSIKDTHYRLDTIRHYPVVWSIEASSRQLARQHEAVPRYTPQGSSISRSEFGNEIAPARTSRTTKSFA